MVIDPTALRRRPVPVDRSADRRVALAAMVGAVAFLAAAILTTFLPEAARRGSWLPLHLALAGGATTAIAGVMPFFVAAITAAPPADTRLRFGAVATVAAGAIGVSVGVVAGMTGLAGASGALFVAGVVLVAVATARPLGQGLGPRRGIVARGYLAALAEVAVGASLATLFLLGWDPLIAHWSQVRVAHAWLNVVGFVSLVIATTLLHFFPTVVGARIAAHPSARAAVASLGTGAPLVAAGVVFSSDALARGGAVVVAVGAGSLSLYAWQIWRTRAHWTTDPGWHAFSIGGLVSAIGWFDVGIAVITGRVLVTGASPAAWSIAGVAGPLVAGWVGLAVLASVSHLIPAVGPGDSASHARQRRLLGRAGLARLAIIDLGVGALSAGLWLDGPELVTAGVAFAALGFGLTAGLFVAAVWALEPRSSSMPPASGAS
jgi:nitrite reductase (NO-forming)